MAVGKLQQARDFNPYEKGVTVEELQKIHRQLAKVLNQRMVRLENTKSPITGEAYTFGAYDLMTDYLEQQGKKGTDERGPRFTESLSAGGMSKAQLQKEIRKMQRFESFESSRVGGMKAIEARRVKTFTEPSDESTKKPISKKTVTTKDFYDFLNSKTFDEISKSISSDTLVEEYDRAADRGLSREEIEKALNEYDEWTRKRDRKMSIKGIKRKLRSRKIK